MLSHSSQRMADDLSGFSSNVTAISEVWDFGRPTSCA